MGGAKWETQLQTYLDRAADRLEVPAAVAVVVTREGSARVLTHGVRCVGRDDPVTAGSSFGIASLTKAFTSTAAAVLVGDGAVTWDTTARTLIPELDPGDPVVAERVTLRDLLAHRSGLADHPLLSWNVAGAPAWILPRLALVESAAGFRDRFVYSSLGYIVAGEMIGRAAGTSWGEVVSRRLLEPLAMTSTTIGPPAGVDADVVCGYHRWRDSVTLIEPLTLSVSAPGNGLYSTADDLVRWLEMLLAGGEIAGRRIVDAAALQETMTPQVAIRSAGPELRAYGLGWYLSSWRGRRIVFHGGGGAGFTSQVRILPDEGVAVAVLSNVTAGALPDIVAERACELILGEEIRDDLLDRAVEGTEKITRLHAAARESLRSTADPDSPSSLELSAYAGCFANPAFGRFEVLVAGDAVGVRFHGVELAAEHLHDDVFMLSSPCMGDVSATFTVVGDEVTAVSVALDSQERVFTRNTGSCVGSSSETAP